MKRYSIDDILTWFIQYRRWRTADNIDPIGHTNFEEELFQLLLYIKNNEVKK